MKKKCLYRKIAGYPHHLFLGQLRELCVQCFHFKFEGIQFFHTWTYVWQAGRQLRSMSKTEGSDTVTMEFTYNHAGLRTKKVKKVNGTVTETTEYILNGKNVVELIHTDNTTGTTPTVNKLHFFYDSQDKQAVVDFYGVKYSYAYNMQGDVIGILDSTGNTVVQYS